MPQRDEIEDHIRVPHDPSMAGQDLVVLAKSSTAAQIVDHRLDQLFGGCDKGRYLLEK